MIAIYQRGSQERSTARASKESDSLLSAIGLAWKKCTRSTASRAMPTKKARRSTKAKSKNIVAQSMLAKRREAILKNQPSAAQSFNTAATRPSTSYREASISTDRPCFRIVSEVTGPMLAVFIFDGHGSLSARKFSTVDELVKVIRSASSSRILSRAPDVSAVSGAVR